MKLIADAGSSKTHWCLVAADGTVRERETEGINALGLSADELRARFADALSGPEFGGDIEAVYYYGAGCLSASVRDKVAAALPEAPRKEVATDLLGAARALLGHEAGLAVILGTGSNSGLYDGNRIVSNMPPLGYIAGDEGSATDLGRALVHAIYRDEAPRSLRKRLEDYLGTTYSGIIGRIYGPGAEPRRFLASLAPFMAGEPDARRIAARRFEALFAAMAAYYGELPPMGLTGGIAAGFEQTIREAAERGGHTILKTEERPMAGLITYHLSHD